MEAHRISSQLLRHRLNADYYTREALENDDRVRHYGCVTLGSKFNHADSGYGVLPGSEEYLPAGKGIGLVRGGDLQLGAINPPGVNAPLSYQTDWTMLRKGDVLLLIKGACIDSPEGVGLVGDLEAGRIFNGSCYRIRLSGYDSGFLVAYCLTRFFLIQKKREIANTGISYNDEDSINDYLVPNSAPRVQTYIGDKVRQAERLRTQAQTLEQGFTDAIRQQCPEVFGEPKAFGRSSLVTASNLRRDLNPGAFNPERLRIRAEIKKAGGRELIDVATIEAAVTDSFGPDDEYIGLDAVSSATSQLAPVKVAQAEVEGAARVLREGPVISKLRPYLNKVGYIPAELARAVGSTELLCVIPKPGVSGWFIYGVLKLQCTVRQFQPLANGSTLPRIDAEDVLEVMIPWHADADQLGNGLERAQALYFSAEKITSSAKLLVEALIEGKVTEAELVAAHEALERGDDTADRALLRRLTRNGLDIAGQPPLFPDLDALYTLLAQTREEVQ